jgi:hypothetical protein
VADRAHLPKDDWGLFNEVPEAPEYPAREKYQAHLLEQYKLYVEMADRVSQRRLTTNQYFLSINSALLAAVGYLTTKETSSYLWLIGAAGVVLSVLWFQIVTSYRDLNSAKFKILHEVERQLPLSLYFAEWNLMGRGESPKLYRPLSHIERIVPWIFIVLHGFVIIHSLFI